jgi:hypothetical protein
MTECNKTGMRILDFVWNFGICRSEILHCMRFSADIFELVLDNALGQNTIKKIVESSTEMTQCFQVDT